MKKVTLTYVMMLVLRQKPETLKLVNPKKSYCNIVGKGFLAPFSNFVQPLPPQPPISQLAALFL